MFATISHWTRDDPFSGDIINQVQNKVIPVLKSVGAKQPIIL